MVNHRESPMTGLKRWSAADSLELYNIEGWGQGYFQINVDGQQVTFTLCCQQNQPRYSRDSIAEFELTTNRFDATKGRSGGARPRST